MKEVKLINPEYSDWGSSMRGPCNAWHGAGLRVKAAYVDAAGVTYHVAYEREYPFGTRYTASREGSPEQDCEFGSLKMAAKSPHLPAFRALLAFSKMKGEVPTIQEEPKSLKKATFQIGYSEFSFTGPTWLSIINQLNSVQDLDCLCRQSRMMGTGKDRKEAEKLDGFLMKCYTGSVTKEDFQSLDLDLSIGALKCLSVDE